MFRKTLAVILTLISIICAISVAASSQVAPPAAFGAPEHFGASHYYNDSVIFTFSAPEDMRNYIERWKAEDENNHTGMSVYYQIDYRIDNGNWHHTSAWDSPKTVPDEIDSLYFVFGTKGNYNSSERWSLYSLFPGDQSLSQFREAGWEYLKSHSITFRVRFTQSFDYGQTFVLSPWSREFTLSAGAKADYDKLINNAPSLVSAELKAKPNGEPYFYIKLGRIPGDIQDLHALSGGSVRTEVWMRRGEDKEFKQIFYEWADEETLEIKASDYFSVDGSKKSYDAESYEIKTRYVLELKYYKQSGREDDIYGPFSNVISRNMPAWSDASKWAVEELKKADDEGLIPDILKGADLTKPITREEFCELALLLYEKSTGKSAVPASPNPFIDTKNPQILKAYALGITQGTSATAFSPDVLINREQCATMLFRTIKAIAPDGDFSIAGVPDFPDQKEISSFAVEGTKFMSKLGIIKGDAQGNFMPKATTTAQKAAAYGMATREAAILMSVRTLDRMDEIKAAPQISTGSSTGESGPAGTNPAAPSAADNSASVVGTWVLGTLSGGKFNAASGRYEGGATGLGQRYTFNADGTYTSLAIWSNTMFFTGRYSVKDGKITLTNRVVEESDDGGKTWGAKEALPDASAYFSAGSDTAEKYLLIGQEGAEPPLVDKKNASRYVMLSDPGAASGTGTTTGTGDTSAAASGTGTTTGTGDTSAAASGTGTTTETGDTSATASGTGDTSGAASGETKTDPAASSSVGTSAASAAGLAEWIVGTWGYSTSNGRVMGDIMHEFKNDGTFYKIVAPMVNGNRTGTEFKGRYRISDGKLILYDQLKSVGPAFADYFDKIWYIRMTGYDTKDEPVEDSEYQISRTADDMLQIGDTIYTRGR